MSAIVGGEILPKVVWCLDLNNEPSISVPAVRTIANISTSDDNYTISKAIFEGLIPRLLTYFEGGNSWCMKIISEVCWTFSNIFASGSTLIEEVLNYHEGEVFKRLFEMVKSKAVDIAKESLWAILNAITEADFAIRLRLVDMFGDEIIESLIVGLSMHRDYKQMQSCLQAVEALLQIDNLSQMER